MTSQDPLQRMREDKVHFVRVRFQPAYHARIRDEAYHRWYRQSGIEASR